MSDLVLRNNLLIALPNLAETPFERTVTLLCEHNDEGALGLVVNRTTELVLATMLDHLELGHEAIAAEGIPIYWGGPVSSERGFVLHRDDSRWESTIPLSPTLSLTSSKDILEAIGAGRGPKQFLVMLGYAGWDSGQLERELGENAWLSTQLDETIVFDIDCQQRWAAATGSLGIDPLSLSTQIGHA
ncbi:MAG: YqgE/AlgH family protein [Oceanococcaceae bacterium]